MKILRSILAFVFAPVFLLLLSSIAPVNRGVAEKAVIRLGFIPLTDCAPIVMAKELGLFEKFGVNGPSATIREIEDVHLPRPRDKRETVNLDEYKIIRDRLLSLLVEKVVVEKSDFYEEEIVV